MAIPGNLLSVTTETVDPNTSGWAAKLNCTISLGSGGRVGAGVLAVRSVAAGEMQARTFSSYEVVPGDTYFTFADASASTQAERIGIRWLSSTGVELSVTWSLTTASGSASWHRVSVAGVAPEGAARAQVLLSSTVAGAAVFHYWENLYFGYPLRLPGNLLSFDAESGGEIGTGTWAAETNCAVSRVAAMVSWAATAYYVGGHEVALTVTSNGNASALCVERPPVTEGVEYSAFAYLNPPTSGSACWVELRFYDGAGTQLQANRSTLAAPGTGWYRQITSGVAPAGAVTASLAAGITSGTAAQVMRFEGAYIAPLSVAATASLRTGNVLPAADWDFEQGVGAWTVSSGAATLARSTPWGAQAVYDSYSLTVSSSTATSSVIRSGIYPIPDATGLTYRSEVYVKVTAGGWTWAPAFRWFDESGTYLSTTSEAPVAVPSPGWWQLVGSQSAPAGAAKVQVEYTWTATSSSSVLYMDRPAAWQDLPLLSVEVSEETASTRLVLRELALGYLLTVWRVTPDGARTPVRGPDGLYDGTVVIVSDSMVIEDYEAPLGVPIYYRVLIRSGALQEDRSADAVTIPAGDINRAWLTDPGRPGIGLQLLVKTAPDWQQSIEQTVFRVRGRAAPVVRSERRGSREGSLVVWTETDDQREALRFLLSTGNILLWRSAPGMGESDVYVSVGQTQFPRVVPYAPMPWREWTLPLTEVDVPTSGQAGSATWTVHDVLVENASGYDVVDRYATVFDLATDTRRA